MELSTLKIELDDEVSTILASTFKIDVTETKTVPHSSDSAITFPNLDQQYQATKLIETTVLYIDIRRSTELSLQHKPTVVARLYSAFVRAMTRCARQFGGEVRGIIGDRVMVLFNEKDCFQNAVDTAELMNSVGRYIINKHFTHNEVAFGIGIDYGRMLATKTGIRRRGVNQQSYQSLVWLGRPANVASKLTDAANKPAETRDLVITVVKHVNALGGLYESEVWPQEFIKNFWYDPSRRLMISFDSTFHSFSYKNKNVVLKESTPAILMSRAVYAGYKAERPDAIEIKNGWITEKNIEITGYTDKTFGGDVVFTAFQPAAK